MTGKQLHCWEYTDCPETICAECQVFVDKATKCWEYENTKCGEVLGIERDCHKCRYYQAMAAYRTDPVEAKTQDRPEA